MPPKNATHKMGCEKTTPESKLDSNSEFVFTQSKVTGIINKEFC